jgi:uncharacterized protein (DUF1501 family)
MLIKKNEWSYSRRDFLRAGMFGVGVSAGLPALLQQVSLAQTAKTLEGGSEKHPNRILVVVELSGGNDGLHTVVPYANDDYYKARPRIAIDKDRVLKIDDQYGFHPSCVGLHELYHDGKMAIVHGCGYPNPNLSHFTAMEWWHTAVPHGNDKYGWVGRFADAYQPDPIESYLVNISAKQSLAINSATHSPVTFKDPRKFRRFGTPAQQKVFDEFGEVYPTTNTSLDFLNKVSKTATSGAVVVRGACSEYRTMVEYGSDNELTLDLKKVAAMINAELPTRIFYLSMGGFDHHAAQEQLAQLLYIYMCDALRGFFEDINRIGRGDDVAMMVFTEFGRRVNDNASGGTDHGTATPIFMLGNPVKGGLYGEHPSLTDLDNGNLKMTRDFRSVYATMMKDWMGFEDTNTILKGDYPTVAGVFG